jgi:hypothetical protein
MSETDMKTLLSGHFKTFEHKLGQIRNVSTLERMLAVAYDADATVKRVERIKGRIEEVSAGTGLARTARPDTAPRPVTGRPVSPQ